jgi:hypothetical protein
LTYLVFFQAAEACRPGKAALDHSALEQQHEALRCLGQLDQLQLAPMGLAVLLGCSTVQP